MSHLLQLKVNDKAIINNCIEFSIHTHKFNQLFIIEKTVVMLLKKIFGIQIQIRIRFGMVN